jgi:hypothetical protein
MFLLKSTNIKYGKNHGSIPIAAKSKSGETGFDFERRSDEANEGRRFKETPPRTIRSPQRRGGEKGIRPASGQAGSRL